MDICSALIKRWRHLSIKLTEVETCAIDKVRAETTENQQLVCVWQGK